MGKHLLISVLCLLFAVLCGCQGENVPLKNAGHAAQKPASEAGKVDSGMVGIIKKVVFDENKSKPVGQVFDEYRYFIRREWKEATAANKTVYVDFVGWLDAKGFDARLKKEGVIARAVNVKFVVKPDDTCFVGMITLYDTKSDGKIYPHTVPVAGIMNAIYANTVLPPL